MCNGGIEMAAMQGRGKGGHCRDYIKELPIYNFTTDPVTWSQVMVGKNCKGGQVDKILDIKIHQVLTIFTEHLFI